MHPMKIIKSKLAVLMVCLAASDGVLSAGYVNYSCVAGNNLFSPALLSGSSTLSLIFGNSPTPEGTIVSLWNPATLSFDTTSTNLNGSWSLDFQLLPGTGAEIFAPSPFTLTVVGTPLNHDGNPLTGAGLTPPPLFTGSDGVYLLADKSPIFNSGTNIFINILGRLPNVGEKVTQLSGTSTYLGDGLWDSLPTLSVSSAAFLTINSSPVPEPSALAVCFMGFGVFALGRRFYR